MREVEAELKEAERIVRTLHPLSILSHSPPLATKAGFSCVSSDKAYGYGSSQLLS